MLSGSRRGSECIQSREGMQKTGHNTHFRQTPFELGNQPHILEPAQQAESTQAEIGKLAKLEIDGRLAAVDDESGGDGDAGSLRDGSAVTATAN